MPNQHQHSLLAQLFDGDSPLSFDANSPQSAAMESANFGKPIADIVKPGAIRCLRMAYAPLEDCPHGTPPLLVAQLECDEVCPELVAEPPSEMVEPEQAKPRVVEKKFKAAA